MAGDVRRRRQNEGFPWGDLIYNGLCLLLTIFAGRASLDFGSQGFISYISRWWWLQLSQTTRRTRRISSFGWNWGTLGRW